MDPTGVDSFPFDRKYISASYIVAYGYSNWHDREILLYRSVVITKEKMSTKPENSKQRIQFDFTTESLKRLAELKEKTDASTKAEVVRNALRLYEWFVNQIEPNSIVEIKDREGKTLYKIPVDRLL
jgi:hypothetical protein